MNEDKVIKLAKEVVEFVVPKVKGTDFTPAEVSYALGEAIAILTLFPLSEQIKALEEAQQQPEEEEEEKENEEEFGLRDLSEIQFAFDKLYAKYTSEDCRLILEGKQRVPQWLQKEIVERRG